MADVDEPMNESPFSRALEIDADSFDVIWKD
jgi:hypothetical protein